MKILFNIFGLLLFGGILMAGLNPIWAQAEQEEQTEQVKEKDEAPLPEVPPRGQMGFVEIKTTPAKALVFLDGEELGKTPIEKRRFHTGRFDMTIQMGGEDLVMERVNVWPDKVTLIERNLVFPYGSIMLTTKPGYTRVYIDDEEVGKTSGGPLTINNVQAGTHVVKVTARGRKSREVEVTVNGEDTVKVNISLGK